MAESASDYHRGEMDIHAQQDTFKGFIKMSKWVSLAVAVSVLFFTLLFCTPLGFLASVAISVIVAVIGVVLLREKSGPAH